MTPDASRVQSFLPDIETPTILLVGCGPAGSPPPISSVGPVARTWRIGRMMEPSAGSLVEGSSQSSRDVLHPSGALDRAASPELREEIGRTLSRGPAVLSSTAPALAALMAPGSLFSSTPVVPRRPRTSSSCCPHRHRSSFNSSNRRVSASTATSTSSRPCRSRSTSLLSKSLSRLD